MDEIICPICGRANTPQAENCRYCQAPLDKPEKPPSEQLFESVDDPEFIKKRSSSKNKTEEDPKDDENVPEWLKRIRELKKADDERELEKEKWRQQTLFGQDNHQKTNVAHKPPAKRTDEMTNPKKGKALSENHPAESQTNKPMASTSEEPNPQKAVKGVDIKADEDLPEGYESLPNE